MNSKITLIAFLTLLFSSLTLMHFHHSAASGFNILPEDETDNKKENDRVSEIKEVVDEYDKIITEEIGNSKTVGSAIAVVYKDQIVYLKCFGVREAGEMEPVDENTIFRLASVSKAITGVLTGILAGENIIELDDKVADYIPGFKLRNRECAKELTVRNILSHTSGLTPHAYDNLVEEKVPLQQIISVLDKASLTAKPGKIYSYQNVMFSLIAPVIEAKTLKSYGGVLNTKIFISFGMHNRSVDFQSFKEYENKAFPHIMRNGSYTPVKLNDRYYTTAPAAGVNSTVSDMANFLLTLLKTEEQETGNKIFQTIFTPQIETGGKIRNWDNIDSRHYAIGWRIVECQGRKIAYHGGYVQGYRSEIALCRDEKAGIVYLSNSPHLVATKIIPLFLKQLYHYFDNKPVYTSIGEAAASQKLSQ